MKRNMYGYTGCFYDDPEYMRDDIDSIRMDGFEYILRGWNDDCFCNWIVPNFTDTKYEGATTFYSETECDRQNCLYDI